MPPLYFSQNKMRYLAVGKEEAYLSPESETWYPWLLSGLLWAAHRRVLHNGAGNLHYEWDNFHKLCVPVDVTGSHLFSCGSQSWPDLADNLRASCMAPSLHCSSPFLHF